MIPHQCLGAVWSRRDRDKTKTAATVAASNGGRARSSEASSVAATVEQFNAVSYRVISTILVGTTEPRSHQLRAKIITKWIDIAQVRSFDLLRFFQLSSRFGLFIDIQCDSLKWLNLDGFLWQELRVLKNFSSLKAIISALQSNPIYRLKHEWAAVPKDKVHVFDNIFGSVNKLQKIMWKHPMIEVVFSIFQPIISSFEISKWYQ